MRKFQAHTWAFQPKCVNCGKIYSTRDDAWPAKDGRCSKYTKYGHLAVGCTEVVGEMTNITENRAIVSGIYNV